MIAFFLRLLRLFITSVLCSLPIHLVRVADLILISGKVLFTDRVILALSFIAFIIAIGIDAYRFSFVFFNIRDYFLGQLLPLVTYIAAGFLICLNFPPVVFNRIFLPLRFVYFFGMKTIESIGIVALALLLLITVLRLLGARSGRLFSDED